MENKLPLVPKLRRGLQSSGATSVEVFFSCADQPDVRPRPTDGTPNAYLRVIGIDELAKELRARGAEILDGPKNLWAMRTRSDGLPGLILCFGEDTRAPERTAPAPLNSTLDVRKVGTDE